MENNREITTDLENILELIVVAEDYGFGRSIFYSAMFDLVKPLSMEEIQAFADRYNTPEFQEIGYGDEDYENALNTLHELNEQYGK